ncbi:hypothetical protein ONE63_006808 [Megalurothrips usitatus]|uniref:Rho-GAP domain-containing protein n=1 Tax=Megalurothrips usitatus TaxID=439358 RepID=A0AAV7XR47_9NEOP|nr:hypothetical protein ONE63_006808 [Megalurothrips usitatus]
MYNFDVDVPKEDLNSAIIQELRLLGLKHGSIPKRTSKNAQISKGVQHRGCVFHKPLHLLSSRIVQLQSGVEAEVPNILQEICCCVVQQAGTEGLFRKAGSTARQKELRMLIDQGHKIQFSQHHVIDIANILKYFLRELPEPVLPFAYHDLFLHCLLLEDTVSAVLLVSLLLPRPHLHVLAYLMEFFHLISELSETNKMNISNLAIVVTPSLMPVSEKVSVQNPQRIGAQVRIVEVLISNADRIGVLPDGVVGKLSLTPSVSNISLLSDDHTSSAAFSSKKKRRRSGSLTRMFNGLKKIVAGKPSPGTDTEYSGMEEEAALVPSTTDFSTPCVKSAKKRKAMDTTSAFSSKKKRDVLMALPQSTALANTPFKKKSKPTLAADSSETPRVCPHPNPPSNQKVKSKSPQKTKHRKFFPSRTNSESDNSRATSSTKKALSGVGNFVIKKQKQRAERHSTSGNFLERSWSAVSSSSWGRKKLRQSDQTRLSVLSTSSTYAPMESDSSHDADIGIDLSQEDPFDTSPDDFVQVPKTEYEDLKSRLCAIESCISQEFNNVSSSETKASPENMNAANTVLAVQTVYEKTLEDADIAKDVSTDQLAKRLSRELKIRRSSECRVIRSPSARKIGSLRRRSRERQSPSLRRELRRNKSWHMMNRPVNVSLSTTSSLSSVDVPSVNNSRLKRGRPNTVFSGLPHPTPNRVSKEIKIDDIIPILGADSSPITRNQARRASSFHGSEAPSPVLPSSKKCKSQVNLAKAALLAHAQQKSKINMESDEKWRDAQELLSSSKELLSGVPTTGRESIAKLRSENAGKVLATAKLFNGNSETAKPSEIRRSNGNETPPQRSSLGNRHVDSTPEKRMVDGTHIRQPLISNKDLCLPKSSAKQRVTTSNISANVKKSNSESPAALSHARKLRMRTSPTHSPSVKSAATKVKKHSSMKVGRVAHSQPVKRNLSVPIQLIDCGKENQIDKAMSNVSHIARGVSPQATKEPVPLTDRIQRISVSPLKDCNRISVQPVNPQPSKYPLTMPCTPNIKQPLTVLTPRRKGFTPQRAYPGSTPLKVMATPSITPIQQRASRFHHNTKAANKLIRPCK